MSVALFMATVIPGFPLTVILNTLLLFLLQINDLIASVGFVHASRTGTIADVTIFASPFRLTGAIIVAYFVNAMTVLAWIVSAFVASILFTSFTRRSGRAPASKVCSVIAIDAGSSISARRAIAWCSSKLAIVPKVSHRASTMMSTFLVGANSAILTRIALAKVSPGLTIAAHPSGTTNTVVIVDQLDALLCAQRGTGIGQALVDITFASGTDITGGTFTFVSTNFIDAGSAMMASSLETVVDVDFAKNTNGAMRTGTFEIVDEVIADTIILTRVREAVVDVVFAILALETFRTFALVGTDEIATCGSILARIGLAFVDFFLTIASLVALGTNTLVAVSNVSTVASILAELLCTGKSRVNGSGFARHLSHIAEFSSPSSLTLALERSTSLQTTGSIFAR